MTKAQVGELLKAAEQGVQATARRLKEHKKNEPLPAEWSHDIAHTIQALQRASRWDGKDSEEGRPAAEENAGQGAAKRGRKASAEDEAEE